MSASTTDALKNAIKHEKQLNNAKKKEKNTVHWFRKGLRLHDNPALRAGIKGATTLRCIFVIDPWFAGSNVGINKWRFLLQCLEDLDHNLRKINSRLFVVRGQPADALPKLFKEWKTTCITFEEDPEPYGKVRDQNVLEMCKELNIEVISAVSHTLFKLDTIIERNNNRAPLTYNQFQAVIASMDPPSPAESSITAEFLGNTFTPITDDHDDKYNVPTLDELGFDIDALKPPVWVGGETEALARLERHLERKAWVASFGRPKMTPQSLLASQTGLSPYLRFGCLSTRLFYHQLTDLYKKIKKAMPPLSLHGQLLWREFFYCAATRNPNFDKMEGNQICVQIPWDKNPEALAKWANGQTGFPWIDAIMTQLREEGWIHHLARHAVACFLTRGDLWLSWEEGMKIFEELLLDADWSVNAGMWMWLSCSSFFQQFFHCYCPVRFGRKADSNGDYIRRYLPVLKNYPTKYIHEPWNAPESVQKAAKCIVGKDYPVPMVNHAIVSRNNMERMKQVYYQLSKYKILSEEKENSQKGVSAIANSLAAAARSSTYVPYAVSSPSPTTVIANTNNSGNYLCQQVRRIPTSTVTSGELNSLSIVHNVNNNYGQHQFHQRQIPFTKSELLPLNVYEAMQQQQKHEQELKKNHSHRHQQQAQHQQDLESYNQDSYENQELFIKTNKISNENLSIKNYQITADDLSYRKEYINNSIKRYAYNNSSNEFGDVLSSDSYKHDPAVNLNQININANENLRNIYDTNNFQQRINITESNNSKKTMESNSNDKYKLEKNEK